MHTMVRLSVYRHNVWHDSGGLLCLPQNSNSENPNCVAIEGVLEAYFQSLRTVQLYGPTNFAPVINQVARWETAKSRCGLIWTNYPRDELESLSCINPATKKKKSVCFICTCHSLIIGSQLLCVINAKTCMFSADISISRCPWASDAWCHSVLALGIWGWSWMLGSPNGSRAWHHCCSLQRTHLKSVDL